jgi:Flp pilus assembly protein TadG
MIMYRRFIKFWRDRRAAAGAEFALLSIVFAGILLGIIDFNILMFEYNKVEQACRVGVRHAVMNNMVAPGIAAWDSTTAGCQSGNPIPVNALDPNPVTCDDSSCDAYGYDANAYQSIVNEMSSVYGRVLTDSAVNIEVTYENIGHGFCGVPNGPDIWPLTTVTLSGPTHDFITPLVGAVTTVEFTCEATLTGEDFNTCENGTGASWCPPPP